MTVDPQLGDSMVLLMFLTLILITALVFVLLTLVMMTIMVYLMLVSVKELRNDAFKNTVSHSTGNVCPHCQLPSQVQGTVLNSSAHKLNTSSLQAEASNTIEALQLPAKNLRNHFTTPSRINNTAALENNEVKNDDLNMETNSTLHYIHSMLSENENEIFDLAQHVDTDQSAIHIAKITKNNTNNNSDLEIIDSKDNNSSSSLNDTSNTLSNNNSFDGSEKHVKLLSECEQGVIIENTISTNEKIIEPTVKLSNSVTNVEMFQMKRKNSFNQFRSTDNMSKTNLSSDQDCTHEGKSLIESDVDLEDTGNNTISSTEQSDTVNKINIKKESEEDFSKTLDIAVKHTDFYDQDNGIIDCKENGSTQDSEEFTDLKTYAADTENESYPHVINKDFEKLETQCSETLSPNSSKKLLQNDSINKVISTTISSESLPKESSKNIEIDETSIKVSESTTPDIPNDFSLVDTDQNAKLTGLSIKSLPETSVKKVEETDHKLSLNTILKKTPMDDFSTSHNVNLNEDISIKEASKTIESKDILKAKESSESKSPNSVEHSTSTETSSEDPLSQNESIKKVISTTISSESLSKESSENIEIVETSIKVSKSTTPDISNDFSLVDTDQNAKLTGLSIKSLPETSVKKVEETDHKLSLNTILKKTPVDDFSTSHNVNLPLNEDISIKEASKAIKSEDILKAKVSSASKSPNNVEHSTSTETSIEDPLSLLFKEADEMYQNLDYDNLYVLLKHSKIDQKNDEFLWRLGRVTWQRAMKESNETEQFSLHKEALGYCHSALALNETNDAVHRWIGIITDYVAKATDIRTRVAQSVVCREHMFRAVELNPNDGTSWHLLGFWHYCAAELPWYQRRIAKALFNTDFNGTYEQALNYFLRGYKNNLEFYSTNVYMIGRCYQKMGLRSEAITWVRLARDHRPIRTWNDEETHQEATRTLKKLEAK